MPRGTAPGDSGGPGGRGRGGEPSGGRGQGGDSAADREARRGQSISELGKARSTTPAEANQSAFAEVRAQRNQTAREGFLAVDRAQHQELMDAARVTTKARDEAMKQAGKDFAKGFGMGGPVMGALAAIGGYGIRQALADPDPELEAAEQRMAELGLTGATPAEIAGQGRMSGRGARGTQMAGGEGAAATVLKPGPGAGTQPEEDRMAADTPLAAVQNAASTWQPQPVAPDVSFLARVNADIERARQAGRTRAVV